MLGSKDVSKTSSNVILQGGKVPTRQVPYRLQYKVFKFYET